MKNFKRRYIILILVLCVFSVLIFLAKYANQPVKRNIDISKIPLTIGQWQGEDYAVNEEIKDSFKTDSIIMRKYLKADSLIWLDIFYYKDDREVLRLPDSSYIQDGSYIAKSETEEIIDSGWRAFSTNKLTIKGENGKQIMIYYFETSGIITSRYHGLRWHMMINKLKAENNSCALVRFSAPVKEDQEKTIAELKQFIQAAAPVISVCLFGE